MTCDGLVETIVAHVAAPPVGGGVTVPPPAPPPPPPPPRAEAAAGAARTAMAQRVRRRLDRDMAGDPPRSAVAPASGRWSYDLQLAEAEDVVVGDDHLDLVLELGRRGDRLEEPARAQRRTHLPAHPRGGDAGVPELMGGPARDVDRLALAQVALALGRAAADAA